MIRYKSDLFGLRTLFMWSGSAASRALIPALVSTLMAFFYWEYWNRDELELLIQDSYAIAVMIGFFGFLLTTRLNFAYQRWWEAISMCHRSTSKFTDSAVCLASYHFQARNHRWEPPTSYGETGRTIATTQALKDMTISDLMNLDNKKTNNNWPPVTTAPVAGRQIGSLSPSTTPKSPHHTNPIKTKERKFMHWMHPKLPFRLPQSSSRSQTSQHNDASEPNMKNAAAATNQPIPRPIPLSQRKRTWSVSNLIPSTKSFTPNRQRGISSSQEQGGWAGGGSMGIQEQCYQFPVSDFLEEMIHLYSLLNAVAMASLRHDVEGCPSPLCEYRANNPWPPYNCENYTLLEPPVEEENGDGTHVPNKCNENCLPLYDKLRSLFYFLVGLDSSPKQRTLYNAGRPFTVLGGVSEAEATRLQLARGPMAQVALCQLWLKEFIVREHLHGSTGDVAAPLVSRVLAFLSEGIAAYHLCRNVAYVPFPFAHEQLTRFFTFVVVFCFPILYVAYVNTRFMALLMNFVTLLCFQGIYEVARELSNPYHTVPNDLPLNLFHAQFNESLRTVLTGFHPDAMKSKKEDASELWMDSSSSLLSMPTGYATWATSSTQQNGTIPE